MRSTTELDTYLGFSVRSNTFDHAIVESVCLRNEYRLPDDMGEIDIVIDIGAHIGSFTSAVIERGANHVIAIEPAKENYDLAKLNLQSHLDQDKVTLLNAAVWRSDDRVEQLSVGGFPAYEDLGLNTGGASLVALGAGASDGQKVDTLAFDTLISRYVKNGDQRIFVKLDCEGSEWPILYTSSKLNSVYAICGELHPDNANQELFSDTSFKTTPHGLKDFFVNQGFKFQFIANANSPIDPNNHPYGLFWAINQNTSA